MVDSGASPHASPAGAYPPLPRLETGVAGLDLVLDGGLVAGATCLVLGPPGTGKTTLGNQVAFCHARTGGVALFVTALAESHERMLRRLSGFAFFDPALVGERVHYLSLLDTLDEAGLDGVLAVVRREVRAREATLLVLDGMSLIEETAASPTELRRFVHRLQAAVGLAGCTALLLAGHGAAGGPGGPGGPGAAGGPVGTHADGILDLGLDPLGVRDLRTLRVVKFRGTQHLLGRHDLAITDAGLTVHPRLEAAAGRRRAQHPASHRLSLGVAGLDAMLGGGVFPGTTTMVLGTPGSGKTITGLHFLAAGVAAGERTLVSTFHETPDGLAATAAAIGLDLAGPIADGRVVVWWQAPLETSPDAWAWDLLRRVDELRPGRLFVDGLSDVYRLHPFPERTPPYLTALANELRARGVTTLGTVELDEYVGSHLASPLPAVSALVDNGILLRHVEVRSRLHRLVSVLKARQSTAQPEIRRFEIGPAGFSVGEPFAGAAALLTGAALPEPDGDPDGGAGPAPGPAPGHAPRPAPEGRST